MLKRGFSLAVLLLAGGSTTSAQLISIRTVPVSQAHQFEIFPSATLAMGGVSVALGDSLLDAFSNPAMGARLRTTRFFGSPSVYAVSNNAGAGRTLPLGALTKRGPWFGGVWFALQEVDLSDGFGQFAAAPCRACIVSGIDIPAFERSHGNTYGFAALGREVADGLSLGGSVLWSRLEAIDGVDLLYAGSVGLEQYGHALDVRLGVRREWPGERTLQAVALHHRFDTTHDVYYFDMFWDPGAQQMANRARIEQNLDRTNAWGLHVSYQHPLDAAGWRMGWLATVNRMDHPKIPNYAIMNIPRDPGNSSAFNVGLGIARRLDTATLGIDVIFEPIWSHTWADSETPVVTAQGRTIPPGGPTIENRFRFANARMRMGLDQAFPIGGDVHGALQLGLGVNRIDYDLEQHDHVQISSRRQHESWAEWTPSWGLSLRFPDVEIRYRGSVTNGTGRPGAIDSGLVGVPRMLSASNILVAPSGPLALTPVKITSHQISLSLPLH